MAEFTAGDVIVPVVPSAKGFINDLKKQIVPGAYDVGQAVGRDIQRGIRDALGGIYAPLQEQTRRQQQQAPRDGEQVGGAFARGFKARVEAALRSLPTVEVDADSTAAQVKVAELRARLQELSGKTVGVDVDAAAATAEVAAIQRELAALDGKAVSADVRVDIASALTELVAVDAGLSRVDGKVANARVDVDVAGALAGLAAVTAGLVAIPAVATAALGAGALGGVMAAAGAGFAGIAAVAVPSVKRISEALKEQEKATGAAAGATKTASQATTSAAQAAADAASRSAALEQAERRITDAKVAAKAAEEGLTEARRAAKQAAEDLARSVANAALSEESAALSVEEARQRAAEVAADPKATELERRRAEFAVREAEQRHKDAKARSKELRAEQAASDKAGVEGSKQVVAAKEKIAKANQAVKDSEAHLKLLRLQQAAAKEKPKAAAPVAAPAVEASKFSKLSPAAQSAAKQIKDFSDAYVAWQKKLEPSVLPMITGGLKIVQGLFKPLTPLIKGSAAAVVGLEKSASKALGGKFWKSFFSDLSKQAPTAIAGLGKAMLSIGTGVAGVIKAFLPFVPTIVGGIQKAAAAFATWGKGLGKSSGFQTFIAYVRQSWPTVQSIFTGLVTAVKNVVTALLPFGSTVLSAVSGLVGVISRLPPEVIRGIAVAIGAVVVAVKTWGIAQKVLNLALKDNPIGLIITAIGLVVGAVVAAYAAFPEFKAVVDAAIKGITTVISWAWENVIKPAFEALKVFVMTVVAPAVTWLWQNIIVPAWNGISAAVTTAWNTVIQPALKALWTFVKTVLAPAVSWLWENIVKPAFTKIGEWIKTAWTTVIQPALKALWTFITETLAPKISWLYENVVKPAFSKAGEAIKSAWDNVIKPTFDFLKKAITEDIPNGFEKGVGLIKTAWEKVQDVAKKPVQFIVDTVYNNGILKVWNAVAKTLKLPELEPLKFARGGIYPGYTPGKDVGLAAVSGGEAIMRPEWTRAVGENYVHGANAAARKGGVGGVARFLGVAGDPGFAGAFADGGIVGDIKAALAGGIKLGAETLLNPLLSKASAAMGNTPWAQMLVGIPKALIGGFTAMLGEREEKYGGGPAGPGAKKAIAFARAQIGKPYQWGATGPNTFDCSGLTMRSLQAAGLTDVPRVTYGQIHYGKGVSSPAAGDLGFPHSGHVWLYSSANRIVEAPYTGAHVREVAARSAQVIRRPTYDDGGYLMPGTSLVHNGTGRPEPVLTDKQWQAVFQGGSGRGGDGSLVTVGEMHVTPEQSPYAIAEELRFIMGQGLRSRG